MRISKEEKYNTISVEIEQDGEIIKKRVPRIKEDTLDAQRLNKVVNYINQYNPAFGNSSDFILLKYYPGKDICNSTGSATRNSIGERNILIVDNINSRPNTTAIWVYKDNEGLDRFSKYIKYYPDQDQIIENTFFEYHYPCSSYVILHKSGRYYGYFGESYYISMLDDLDKFESSF